MRAAACAPWWSSSARAPRRDPRDGVLAPAPSGSQPTNPRHIRHCLPARSHGNSAGRASRRVGEAARGDPGVGKPRCLLAMIAVSCISRAEKGGNGAEAEELAERDSRRGAAGGALRDPGVVGQHFPGAPWSPREVAPRWPRSSAEGRCGEGGASGDAPGPEGDQRPASQGTREVAPRWPWPSAKGHGQDGCGVEAGAEEEVVASLGRGGGPGRPPGNRARRSGRRSVRLASFPARHHQGTASCAAAVTVLPFGRPPPHWRDHPAGWYRQDPRGSSLTRHDGIDGMGTLDHLRRHHVKAGSAS